MEKQLGFFAAVREIPPKDPNVKPDSVPRLSRQSKAVLLALRGGDQVPARTLSQITHRFGGRVYDLRQAGCLIDVIVDHKTGESWYQLMHEPEGLV